MNTKTKELFRYLTEEFGGELKKQNVSIMVSNTENELCMFSHGKDIKEKNFFLAGVLSRVIANILIENGFTDYEDFSTATAMLQAYTCPINKLNNVNKD